MRALVTLLRCFMPASSPIISWRCRCALWIWWCALWGRGGANQFRYAHDSLERPDAAVARAGRLLWLRESAVVPCDAQRTVGIHAIQLHHSGSDIFQKISVVAHNYTGEAGVKQQSFEPFNSGEIEVIGRFIEQQDFRMLHQGFSDSQAFTPAAG